MQASSLKDLRGKLTDSAPTAIKGMASPRHLSQPSPELGIEVEPVGTPSEEDAEQVPAEDEPATDAAEEELTDQYAYIYIYIYVYTGMFILHAW